MKTEGDMKHIDNVDVSRFWKRANPPENSARREFWVQLAEENEPFKERALKDRHFIPDFAEAHAKVAESLSQPDYFCVNVGDYECEAENVFELEFLVWLSEGMKRGMGFEQSWARAVDQLLFLEDVAQPV